MLRLSRAGDTAVIAVFLGITGLTYVLAGTAAQPDGAVPGVGFTADGKLKRPRRLSQMGVCRHAVDPQ
jgi:hypothetical protein